MYIIPFVVQISVRLCQHNHKELYRGVIRGANARGSCRLIKAMDYIDTNAKCRHLKILTSKGTSRQLFIRFYRLEIHGRFCALQSVILIFPTQLCELLPLLPLWLILPPPFPV
jgi:hypothetical protein